MREQTVPKPVPETVWSNRQFNEKLALVKEYTEKHPNGFAVNLDSWRPPEHRQKRVIVDGVRQAFKDGGLILDKNWSPGRLQAVSIQIIPIPELGISFAGIATHFDTYIGISKVNWGEDHYNDHFGLMVALYRAAYSYGKEKCRNCLKILADTRPKPLVDSHLDEFAGTMKDVPIGEATRNRLNDCGIERGGTEEHGQPADGQGKG